MSKYEQTYDCWNENKKNVAKNEFIIKFQQYQIIFMKVGANIGYEEDRKGNEFLRPVLVYKKFNNRVFLGIPLTSKPKKDKFHFEFEYKRGKKSYAILSQIRLFDIKRAKYYDGKISKEFFRKLQEKLLDLIVTPLRKKGECTKAICEGIIPQNKTNVKYNILVTGSNGQLGSEIKVLNDKCEMLNYNFFFTDKNELDITDFNAVKNYIKQNNINVIINCAAYTAVDRAEEEKELADLINHKAVENLAKIAKEKDIVLIHISTDYVFDGKSFKPYSEDDTINPINFYGLTKLKGEEAIKKINPKNSIIIRTSWVYSSFGNNFVKTMLKLAKEKEELNIIYDQIGSPTYARDLALALLKIMNYELRVMNKKNNNLIQNSKFKTQNFVRVYHYSNEGVCSWYDFAKAIFEIKDIDIKVNPIETKDYPTPAKRPNYSVLNKAKIKNEFNIKIPYWKESLKEMLSYEV